MKVLRNRKCNAMIESIADQTNLLTKCSYRSSKTEEAGRGFAIVADGGRKLAEQSIRLPMTSKQ